MDKSYRSEKEYDSLVDEAAKLFSKIMEDNGFPLEIGIQVMNNMLCCSLALLPTKQATKFLADMKKDIHYLRGIKKLKFDIKNKI